MLRLTQIWFATLERAAKRPLPCVRTEFASAAWAAVRIAIGLTAGGCGPARRRRHPTSAEDCGQRDTVGRRAEPSPLHLADPRECAVRGPTGNAQTPDLATRHGDRAGSRAAQGPARSVRHGVQPQLSHLDAPLIIGALPRRLARYVAAGAAADYFFDVWWRKGLTALFFNAFPVDRTGLRGKRGMATSLLDDGVPLLLFPEGTRSRTGEMGNFKPGAAALCISRDVPVRAGGIGRRVRRDAARHELAGQAAGRRSTSCSASRCGPRTARRPPSSRTGSPRRSAVSIDYAHELPRAAAATGRWTDAPQPTDRSGCISEARLDRATSKHMKWWGWGVEGVGFHHEDKPGIRAVRGRRRSDLDVTRRAGGAAVSWSRCRSRSRSSRDASPGASSTDIVGDGARAHRDRSTGSCTRTARACATWCGSAPRDHPADPRCRAVPGRRGRGAARSSTWPSPRTR